MVVVAGEEAYCPRTAAWDRFGCCWLIFCTLPPSLLPVLSVPFGASSPVSSPPVCDGRAVAARVWVSASWAQSCPFA